MIAAAMGDSDDVTKGDSDDVTNADDVTNEDNEFEMITEEELKRVDLEQMWWDSSSPYWNSRQLWTIVIRLSSRQQAPEQL